MKPLSYILSFFGLFAFALAISPNFTGNSIGITFKSLVFLWPLSLYFIKKGSMEMNVREFAGHFSFYIAMLSLLALFYLQSHNADILYLSFCWVLLLFFTGKYFPGYYSLFAGLSFFTLCYLSINTYELVHIFRSRLIMPLLFSLLYIESIKGHKILSGISGIILSLFFYHTGYPIYSVYALGLTIILYTSRHFIYNYSKTLAITQSFLYGGFFLLYLLFGLNLIQAL